MSSVLRPTLYCTAPLARKAISKPRVLCSLKKSSERLRRLSAEIQASSLAETLNSISSPSSANRLKMPPGAGGLKGIIYRFTLLRLQTSWWLLLQCLLAQTPQLSLMGNMQGRAFLLLKEESRESC